MTDSAEPPKRTRGDVVHAVVSAAIGSVPVVGAAGAELFKYIVEEPYERRKEEFMRSVGDEIAALRDQKRLDVEQLRNNPAFTDAVLTATHIALKTRDDEKQRALRNAIINAALPTAPSDADQQIFLRLIDELTSWHIRVLSLFDDPAGWLTREGIQPPGMGGLADVLEWAFPTLRGQRELYDQVWADLRVRGLVSVDQLHTTMSGRGLLEPRTTVRGRAFLRFVSRPSAPKK